MFYYKAGSEIHCDVNNQGTKSLSVAKNVSPGILVFFESYADVFFGMDILLANFCEQVIMAPFSAGCIAPLRKYMGNDFLNIRTNYSIICKNAFFEALNYL